ncbi:MAG TPA: hypothetical protein VJS44_08345 [Pyrinomonadaceae bacterium]|nr:hypothetical protein [Pyrinomonadaceae bacterium]
MKIIWLRWRDSQYQFSQQSLEEAIESKVAILETVGHLVSEDSDRVVVAGDWLASEKDVRCVTAIPVENIVERRVLSE